MHKSKDKKEQGARELSVKTRKLGSREYINFGGTRNSCKIRSKFNRRMLIFEGEEGRKEPP